MDASVRNLHRDRGTGGLLAFALLGVPLAAVFLPLGVYLPPFYAQTMGLGLQTAGLVFMASRIWNAVCDPVVGLLSDHTRSRFGRRKPWIAAGSIVFTAGVIAVYWPSRGEMSAFHLVGALFALYLARVRRSARRRVGCQ